MAVTSCKFSVLLFHFLLLLLSFSTHLKLVEGNGVKASGMFVFGSSLVDNGNNNFLKKTTAKANYSPYGIDFPTGPTGRFSNGKNLIDVLGDHLTLPPVPPFADPRTKGARIRYGVNFASGGSGILDTTGSLAGEVFSLNKQIDNFETITLPELQAQLGSGKSKRVSRHHVSKYIFVVGTGGNDYLLNYLRNVNSTEQTPEQFTSFLISTLSNQLQKLYHLGARKLVLFSMQAMGCYPVVTAKSDGRCVDKLNHLALLFNSQLKSLANLSTREKQMPGSTIVFVDSYKIIQDIINNPIQNGFLETTKPCCQVVAIEEGGNGISCNANGSTCSNRAANVFFDGLHPTEAVNMKVAHKAYASDFDSEVYPTNVKKLALL